MGLPLAREASGEDARGWAAAAVGRRRQARPARARKPVRSRSSLRLSASPVSRPSLSRAMKRGGRGGRGRGWARGGGGSNGPLRGSLGAASAPSRNRGLLGAKAMEMMR